MPEAMPYWRLSGFYFVFFSITGALAPYWGPYLRSLDFRAAQIGVLVAILHATKIVAPNIWGWLADVSGSRMLAVRVAAVGATLAFAGVLLGHGFLWLAFVLGVASFFWNAALPQFEANTLNHLGGEDHLYSRIRLWGSVGFIVSVTVLGEVIDREGIHILPVAMVGLFVALAAASLAVPQAGARRHPPGQTAFVHVLRDPRVLAFFVVCFLLQASHGPYYAFYSIFLEDHGYRGAIIGMLWALGVLAEIAVFLVVHRWLPRFGPGRLMTATLALAVIRWSLVGAFPGLLAVQAGAQLLHAATFGVYHAVGIVLVNRYFVGRNQGRGQALYSSLTFGAGVALGSLASGYLWSAIGGSGTFFTAAALAGLGTVVAARADL